MSGPYGSAAPFPLELVRAFVNTSDPDEGDALASREAAARWLVAAGLLPEAEAEGAALDEASLARLHAARAALEELLAANNATGHAAAAPGAAVAAAAVEAVAAGVRLRPTVQEGGGLGLVPAAGGAEAAIGRLLAVAVTATANGTWPRLKACRDPTCRWAFYDRSRNHARTWCDMATCGNRAKVRAYRRRQPRQGRARQAPPPWPAAGR